MHPLRDPLLIRKPEISRNDKKPRKEEREKATFTRHAHTCVVAACLNVPSHTCVHAEALVKTSESGTLGKGEARYMDLITMRRLNTDRAFKHLLGNLYLCSNSPGSG